MRIAVTGISGFIGSHLTQALLEQTDHEVVGLSRSSYQSQNPRLQVKACDLYSLLEIEAALKNCDVAIYLVHSMSPSSRLAQGNFQDFDFILADNFAKAAQTCGVQKIIYVSGIIPENDTLSNHLKSRLEVEETFCKSKIPLLTLRCGLVVGPNGSSFRILDRLVSRLPLMILPSWTQNKLQITALGDLTQILIRAIGENSVLGSFDVGSPETLTYETLIEKVARLKGLSFRCVHFPWIPLVLSKLWISLVTETSRQLVYPLVESLRHSMVVQKPLPRTLAVPFSSVEEALQKSLTREMGSLPMARLPRQPEKSKVQSVQRLPSPKGWNMEKIANEYMKWLPLFMKPFLRVQKEGFQISMKVRGIPRALLVLKLSEERTFETRRLFYIVGGLLARNSKKARMEFRESPDHTFFIAAIHDFEPRLPWYIYKFTQAPLHAWVMKQFGKHLRGIEIGKQ